MKNYYKIHEISKLYGIGPDSLRYYEKLGILRPKRDANGYRLYSLGDIYKLNMIRDLRRLDFSMAQIKEYLDKQSVENTLDMLKKERRLLRDRCRELRRWESILRGRIAVLQDAGSVETGAVSLRSFPERLCLQLSEYITRDEEMDFVVQRLHKRHEDSLQGLGDMTIGAFFSQEDLARGLTNRFHTVFFILEDGAADGDFSLPAGDYLSCFYRGAYEQNGLYLREMMEQARRRGLCVLGEPFELYTVDNRYTNRTEEFLTEIQLRVSHSGKTGEDRKFCGGA